MGQAIPTSGSAKFHIGNETVNLGNNTPISTHGMSFAPHGWMAPNGAGNEQNFQIEGRINNVGT
jgi:hypothetical protein